MLLSPLIYLQSANCEKYGQWEEKGMTPAVAAYRN